MIRVENQRALAAFAFGVVLTLLLTLSGCAKAPLVPLQAPPAVEVLVPVPVPCEVAQVPKSPLVSEGRAIPNDIYEAVKVTLADWAILKADRERLAAANSDPCPQSKDTQ